MAKVSLLQVVARGLGQLPASLRREVRTACVGASALAVVEAGAFGTLFLLIGVISSPFTKHTRALDLFGEDLTRGQQITRVGASALTLLLVRSVGTLWLLRRQARVQATADAFLSEGLFEAFLRTPYSSLVQRNSAESIATITYRVPDVAANSVGVLIALAADAAVVVGVFTMLLVAQPALAVGVIIYFLFVAWGMITLLTPALRSSAFVEASAANASQKVLQEGFSGVKAIKANESVDFFARGFHERREDLKRIRQRRIFLARLPTFYLETSIYVGLALLGVAISKLGNGDVVPVFGTLVAASLRTLPSVNRMVGSVASIRASEAALTIVEAELSDAAHTNIEAPATSEKAPLLITALECRNIGYTYAGASSAALSGINLVVPAGSSVGLVGASGAGKTTLVDIVLGLLEPTSGELRVDGVTLTGPRLAGWRGSIGYVPQEVFLLDGTLRDNVSFGQEGIDDARVVEALAVAELPATSDAFPAGLETMLGERGSRLSGGQRQRIGIARALLREPSLLIMDEATSALDNRTEAAVTAALARIRGKTTSIVIAHRLSTVRTCDTIVMLEGGEVAGVGTFSSLLNDNPAFRELVRMGELAGDDGL